MRGRRRRERMHLNAEINVVSLIDVMLLLLVIFMLTAPMMQGGVDLQLPEGDAKPTETKSGLVVSIDPTGKIWVNDQSMTLREFRGVFSTYVKAKGASGVEFRADKRTVWDVIAPVYEIMINAGVTKLGIVLVPQESSR